MVPKRVPGQSLPLDQPYLSRELFRENYLKNRLPESDLWAAEGLGECRAQIGALYEREAHLLPSYNEPQLEKHFIQPVLGFLGHCYEVQEKETDQPDYAFFPDETARQAAHSKPTGEFWEDAIGVGDAKAWDVNLDAKGEGSPFRQITHYLYHYAKEWGILTNGRLWRLYHRERSRRKPVFYEVDLPRLLEEGSEEDFKYFYLFFRQQAIYEPPHQPFLDVISEEGIRYGEHLQEDLKGQVYQALRYACQGFLSYKPNGLTAADLDEIHDNALVLLYRLLFILYAEARGLLPMDNAEYRGRYSLDAIKQQATGQLAATMTNYWPDVRNLCRAIDRGDEELGVPEYNGGLFDPQRYPFLEEKQLPDKHLAQVLDALARTADGDFLDYSDLEVRHLGSIYEGLLECKLTQATEPMVAVKRQGKELWTADARAQSRTVVDHCQPGDLYLVTDRGERKATGSYYTPQYIVEYIVNNTVGPLVEKCESAADVLQLNILDPAMGSGHFLVEATDYLARAIAEKRSEDWDELTDEERTPFKREVVERCIYGVDLNPLAVELAKLSLWLHTAARGKALNFLDHHLCWGNSLIGAKIEDLAVPPQTGKERPKKEEEAGQIAAFDYDEFTRHATRMVQDFALLQDMSSETRMDVQHKGEILQQLDEAHRRPYREIGDLWCTRYFGNDYNQVRYNQVMGYLQRDPDRDLSHLSPEAQDVLAASRQIAQQRHFFHWEIEFPEVFFDEFGRRKEYPGFDVVAGNPPWTLETTDEEDAYFLRQFATAEGKLNLYRLFMEASLRLIRDMGTHGFVVPDAFLAIPAAEHLRDRIRKTTALQSLVAVNTGAFPDVSENICIYVLSKAATSTELTLVDWRSEGLGDAVMSQIAPDELWFGDTNMILLQHDARVPAIVSKMSALSEGLANSFRFILGQQVYHNTLHEQHEMDERIYHAARQLDETYERELAGSGIERYHVNPKRCEWVKKTERCYSPTPAQFKTGTRLFLREIPEARHLAVGWWDGRGTVNKAAIMIRQADEAPDLRYLLSLLASQPLHRYYLWTSEKSRQDLFPRISLRSVRKLPIRIIDFDHPTDEAGKEELLGRCREAIDQGEYQTPHELARKALANHAARHGPAGKPELKEDAYWKQQIAQADPDFPGREDFVHDLLAELAQRMIDLTEQEHELVQNFETNLRGAAAEELHEKLKKGKQGRTLYKHESCQAYVEDGSGTTHHLPESLAWSPAAFEDFLRELVGAVSNLTDFLEVYCRYTDQYRQVTDALEKTDNLIDQIVYALYGLTEEEIAIVEESTGG